MENCDVETSLAQLLSSSELEEYLQLLGSSWKIDNGELTKTFNLSTFNETITLVNIIAGIAEKQDHHPNLTINYDKLLFQISTHETRETKEAGLTLCDFIFAAKVDLAVHLI